MTTNNQPVMGKKQLIKSVFVAFIIGGIVLITAILPAEYGMDPMGTGELLGFGKLYIEETPEEDKIATTSQLNFKKLTIDKIGSDPNVPKPSELDNPPPEQQYSLREDNNITVVVPAGKGIEYKFKMLKYGSTKYEWSTDGSVLYSDMHGEVLLENPPEKEFFESYTEAYSNNMVGTFTSPFEGIHGWYFRNKNKKDVIVSIKLKGQYQLYDIYKDK